jgi:hypothetical protein
MKYVPINAGAPSETRTRIPVSAIFKHLNILFENKDSIFKA